MFKYYQKFLVILFFCKPIIAMENDKAIIQHKKPFFIPTANTPQANVELLDLLNLISTEKRNFRQDEWEIFSKCLQNGADPRLTAGRWQTPLISLATNNKKLFYYLLQLGVDINEVNRRRWTPLHYFLANSQKSDLQIEDLLENGANPNNPTKIGPTPLLLAIKYSTYNVKPLIQHKANINPENILHSPLDRAITYSKKNCNMIEIIKILCKAGASPININNKKNTAFHVAANKPEEVIKTLITHIKFQNNANIIKLVLLIFNRLGMDYNFSLPKDIKIIILSELLSVDNFHKELYSKCKGERYQHLQFLPLALVNKHVQYLKEILKMENGDRKTAVDLLLNEDNEAFQAFLCGYKTAKEELLEGTILQKDLDILNKAYSDITSIPENNLALQILKNHYYNNS